MRILGIDPGIRVAGFGCVDSLSRRHAATGGLLIARQGDAQLVQMGVIRLDVDTSISRRLLQLNDELDVLLSELKPDAVAVEMLYAHYKHPTTAIVMGHARGVILLCISRRGLPVIELRATQIKKSLTAFGHAGKGQMQAAVQAEFGLAEIPKPADAADAVAIALAALRRGDPSKSIQHDPSSEVTA